MNRSQPEALPESAKPRNREIGEPVRGTGRCVSSWPDQLPAAAHQRAVRSDENSSDENTGLRAVGAKLRDLRQLAGTLVVHHLCLPPDHELYLLGRCNRARM